MCSNHLTIDILPSSPEVWRIRGDLPPVPRMPDISVCFMVLRDSEVTERQRASSENKSWLRPLCSIKESNLAVLTELFMKSCLQKKQTNQPDEEVTCSCPLLLLFSFHFIPGLYKTHKYQLEMS